MTKRSKYLSMSKERIILIVFLCSLTFVNGQDLSLRRVNYDGYGSRFSSNNDTVLLAANDFLGVGFQFFPFGSDYFCFMRYPTTRMFIINAVLIQNQMPNQISFMMLMTTDDDPTRLSLGRVNVNRNQCVSNSSFLTINQRDMVTFQTLPLEASQLIVDFSGRFAHGFLSDFAYTFDINRKNMTFFQWKTLIPKVQTFHPKAAAFSTTSDGYQIALVSGYFAINSDRFLPSIYLFRLEPPSEMIFMDNITLVRDETIPGVFANYYTSEYSSSITVEPKIQSAFVTLPHYQRSLLIGFNSTKLRLLKSFPKSARSAAWLDHGTHIAIVLSEVPTLPWSLSQVQILNVSVENTASATKHGIPNVQQTLDFLTPQQLTPFIHLTIVRNTPILLTSNGFLVAIPPSPPGYFARLSELTSYDPVLEACPLGTYKDITGPFPCIVCPAGFKTNQYSTDNNTGVSCVPCTDDAFCPPGSIADANLSDYPSSSQAYPYPISPASTNFDDIIFTNSFQINGSSGRCIILSPLFWTLLVLGIVFIVLIIMSCLYWTPKNYTKYKFFKTILKHTDLIGEGKLWIGGLFSFAIIILIIFAFWFGLMFLRQYPIETSSDSNFACDRSIRNAKFSSSLQLLALRKSKEEKLLFDMLDEQDWILSLDLIQTAFRCDQITIQGDIESQFIDLPFDQCFVRPDNVTTTIILNLPEHVIDLQVNLTGNSYIGAVRICLDGPFKGSEQNLTVVRQMAFCQLLSTNDQTISQTTSVTMDLTKVINRTEGLSKSDPIRYSGIWIPTLTVKSYTDRIVYNQQGYYRRYLSSRQIFWLHLSETPFFIKNTQEPIALIGEIVFNNILFSTTVIELFGLAFLIVKLGFLPILKRIFYRIHPGRIPPIKELTKF